MLAIATTLLAVTAALPGGAAAEQPFGLSGHCATGALQLCASVDVSVAPNPSGSVRFMIMRILNFGWVRAAGVTTGESTLPVFTGEQASFPDAADGAWLFDARAYGGNGPHDVVCDVPEPRRRGAHPFDIGFQTCAGSGWVEFSFNLRGFWSVAEMEQLLENPNAPIAQEPECQSEMGVECEEEDTTNYIMSGRIRAELMASKWHW